MFLPAQIGDYTDFYASIASRDERREHVPAGQSAAAELQVGADRLSRPRVVDRRRAERDVRRPHGQTRDGAEGAPSFGPTRRLDYELEVGAFIGAGNALGDADLRSTTPRSTSSGSVS